MFCILIIRWVALEECEDVEESVGRDIFLHASENEEPCGDVGVVLVTGALLCLERELQLVERYCKAGLHGHWCCWPQRAKGCGSARENGYNFVGG